MRSFKIAPSISAYPDQTYTYRIKEISTISGSYYYPEYSPFGKFMQRFNICWGTLSDKLADGSYVGMSFDGAKLLISAHKKEHLAAKMLADINDERKVTYHYFTD